MPIAPQTSTRIILLIAIITITISTRIQLKRIATGPLTLLIHSTQNTINILQSSTSSQLKLPTLYYTRTISSQLFYGYKFSKDSKINVDQANILINQLMLENQINNLTLPDEYQVEINERTISHLKLYYPFDSPPNILAPLYQIVNKSEVQNLATRRLVGNGLHQKVNLTILLTLQAQNLLESHPNSKTCYLHIEQILPQTTYIDQYELPVSTYETIDIQLPAHFAKQYFYELNIPWSKSSDKRMIIQERAHRKYQILLPIHFRYPEPAELNYTLVKLQNLEKIEIRCQNKQSSYKGKQSSIQTIIEIKQDPFHNLPSAKIPTGNSADSRLISSLTFISMIIASIILTKNLRKN